MKKGTIFETFHGKNLDELVDKAHETLPIGYEVDSVTTDFLNNEYVVTVHASREKDFIYKTYYAQIVNSGNNLERRPAILQLQDCLDSLNENGDDYEIVKIGENDGMHVNQGNDDYESAWMLVKIYLD